MNMFIWANKQYNNERIFDELYSFSCEIKEQLKHLPSVDHVVTALCCVDNDRSYLLQSYLMMERSSFFRND